MSVPCNVLRRTLKFFIDRKTKRADEKAKHYMLKLINSECPTRKGKRLGAKARKPENK